MNSMFACCSSLISLDLINFDTSNVIDMTRLFWECYSLTSLYLSNFNISENITEKNFFQDILDIKCHIIDCSNNWE